MFGSHCWIRPMQLLPQLAFSSLAPVYRSPRIKSKIFDPDEATVHVTKALAAVMQRDPG